MQCPHILVFFIVCLILGVCEQYGKPCYGLRLGVISKKYIQRNTTPSSQWPLPSLPSFLSPLYVINLWFLGYASCICFFPQMRRCMHIFPYPFLTGRISHYSYSLTGLCIVLSWKSLHVSIWRSPFFLTGVLYSTVWIYHRLLTHTLFLIFHNYKAALNTTFCMCIFVSLEMCLLGSGLGQELSVYFIRNPPISLWEDCTSLCPHQQSTRIPVSPQPHQHNVVIFTCFLFVFQQIS